MIQGIGKGERVTNERSRPMPLHCGRTGMYPE